MGNSVEYINSNCVLFRYSQGREECGALLPFSCKTEATGTELTFYHSIMGSFMANKIWLKQIYCSYSPNHNIQNGFLRSLL